MRLLMPFVHAGGGGSVRSDGIDERPHRVLARDIADDPEGWAAYRDALDAHGFSHEDGIRFLVAKLGHHDEIVAVRRAPTVDLGTARRLSYDLIPICRDALCHAGPWVEFATRTAGRDAVRSTLRYCTECVHDGHDPRVLF